MNGCSRLRAGWRGREDTNGEDMATYRISGTMTISVMVDVEADSKEEAIATAQECPAMSFCNQCAGASEGEWSTSGELDGQPMDLFAERVSK